MKTVGRSCHVRIMHGRRHVIFEIALVPYVRLSQATFQFERSFELKLVIELYQLIVRYVVFSVFDEW